MLTRKLTFILAFMTFAAFTYEAYGACAPKALAKLKKLHKAAMDDYDQMEFSSARKTLEDSISIARREGCDESLEYANILVDLGIFYITDPDNPDVDRGKGRFKKALRINPCAKIGDNLKTPRLQKILDSVRRKLGVKCTGKAPVTDPGPKDPTTNPTPVKSGGDEEDTGPEPSRIEHSPPDEAPRSAALKIKCRAPKKGVSKIVIYYRKPGQSDYTAVEMTNYSGYSYKAVIPGAQVQGAVFQYYIAALGSGGKPVMANGNSGAPNIISLTKAKKGGSSSDPEEDPLGNKKKTDNDGGGNKTPPSDNGEKKWIFKLGARWGIGYLSTSMCSSLAPDTTNDCDGKGMHIANPGFAFGEMGGEFGLHYKINPNLTMGLDVKVGFVTTDYAGPNENNKGVGGMGLLKANYFFMGTKDVFKPYVGGVLGGGVTFHQWEVDEMAGKSDTFQHGYIMVGGAFGFLLGSEKVAFYLNIDAIGIFPEQSTLHIDFTAGLALGF